MKCDFGKGDVIVHIGGHKTYVVADAHTDRYSLLFPVGNSVTYNILYKTFVDSHFVKVDKCNPANYSEVIDKVKNIWYNVREGETRNGR